MRTEKKQPSVLTPIIARYVALKRALGRDYAAETYILHSLDRFLSTLDRVSSDLTSETFAGWSRTLERLTPAGRRRRMQVVRNLCLYRRRTEPECFVPNSALFPARHQPVQPYIFTQADIAHLLAWARGLARTRQMPVRPETFRLGIVLLYTTGLRRGELIRLQTGDYNPQEHTLLIRPSKFHKSRLIPLSEDGAQEVENYLDLRSRSRLSSALDTPLLWNGQRGFHGYTAVGFARKLRHLIQTSGIRKPDGRPPRIHDFRWTFAVHVLLRWYRSGADVQAKLPLLATYMGHASIASTQYYLPLLQSLSTAASSLFAQRYAKLIRPFPVGKGGER